MIPTNLLVAVTLTLPVPEVDWMTIVIFPANKIYPDGFQDSCVFLFGLQTYVDALLYFSSKTYSTFHDEFQDS